MKSMYACKYSDLFYIHDPLSIIGRIFWNWVEADRFDILNKYSPYNFVVDPSVKLPNLTNPSDIPLRDSCLVTATRIINLAKKQNKKIVVLWSGGVDSTSIIASFILAGIEKTDMIILYTEASVEENENTYKFLIENNYQTHRMTWENSIETYTSYGTDVIFITGWCADQLFGSNVNLRYPEQYDMHWKDGLRFIIKDLIKKRLKVKFKKGEIKNAIDVFEDYANKLGIDLQYTCDALWLFNFGIKWSHVSRDFVMTLEDQEQRKNVINFYDDIPFQEWSLCNYKEFYKHNQSLDVAYYKRPLKEIAFEVFKDEDYLNNKGKGNSWKSFVMSSNNRDTLQYSRLAIWDTEEGIKQYRLDIEPEYPTEREEIHLAELRNRRKFMQPYLKIDIDEIRYLSGEFW